MENLKWYPVSYNGLETNIEVTECAKIRRVKHDWVAISNRSKFGIVDFNKLKLHPCGYLSLHIHIKTIGRKVLLVHQLISSAFHNYIFSNKKNVVDHIDGNKSNNHKENLRVISQRENITSYHRSKNRELPTGVFYIKNKRRYRAGITFNKKTIHLGYYDNAESASNAYQNHLKLISL